MTRPTTDEGRYLTDVASRIDRETVEVDINWLRMTVIAIEKEAASTAIRDVAMQVMDLDVTQTLNPPMHDHQYIVRDDVLHILHASDPAS